jgi:hypothetical protein
MKRAWNNQARRSVLEPMREQGIPPLVLAYGVIVALLLLGALL